MNISVRPKFQGKGFGKALVRKAIEEAHAMGARRLEVGTGNSSIDQIGFYRKRGFAMTGIDRGFFTRNYEEKIVENGIPCRDMLRFSMEL